MARTVLMYVAIPRQSLLQKPILTEQALPVSRRSPRLWLLPNNRGRRRRLPCALTNNKRHLTRPATVTLFALPRCFLQSLQFWLPRPRAKNRVQVGGPRG